MPPLRSRISFRRNCSDATFSSSQSLRQSLSALTRAPQQPLPTTTSSVPTFSTASPIPSSPSPSRPQGLSFHTTPAARPPRPYVPPAAAPSSLSSSDHSPPGTVVVDDFPDHVADDVPDHVTDHFPDHFSDDVSDDVLNDLPAPVPATAPAGFFCTFPAPPVPATDPPPVPPTVPAAVPASSSAPPEVRRASLDTPSVTRLASVPKRGSSSVSAAHLADIRMSGGEDLLGAGGEVLAFTMARTGGGGGGLARIPRVVRRRIGGLLKSVSVEALPQGDAWRVLWASDVLSVEGDGAWPCVRTSSATVEPGDCRELKDEDDRFEGGCETGCAGVKGGASRARGGNFVFQGDQFEVRVVGFSVTGYDMPPPGPGKANELILTSREVPARGEKKSAGTMPRIHFDFRRDHSSESDRYQPVSDAASLASRSCGRTGKRGVNVNFVIMEVNDVGEETRTTIDHVGELSKKLQDASAGVPYLGALTPVLNLAGQLGNCALQAHAKADHVIAIDMDFQILKRGVASLQRSGDYLRYGYFFFLSKPLDVKLYAATRSSKNVRLMMRTEEGKFVPLRHVSYVVVKVVVPREELESSEKAGIALEHAQTLQRVCENVQSMSAEQVKSQIEEVMRSINGVASPPSTIDAKTAINGVLIAKAG